MNENGPPCPQRESPERQSPTPDSLAQGFVKVAAKEPGECYLMA